MLLNKAFDRSSPRLTELWMTGRSTEVMKLVTLGPGAIRVERTLTNCTIVHQTRVRDRPGDWYEHVAIGFERMKLMYSRSSFQDR
jgi:type VI protein secretion system component Hcp